MTMAVPSLTSMSSLDKVKEELSCDICFEKFRSPKVLPCFHTFCQQCLEDIRRRSRGQQIPCPTCRSSVSLPELADVGKLPNNFLVNRVLEVLQLEDAGGNAFICTNCGDNREAQWQCIDCSAFLCEACKDAHDRMAQITKNHRIRALGTDGISDVSQIEELLFRPINCDKHNQELKLYCNTCEKCACALCFATEHQGHELSDVAQAAEKHKMAIRRLMTNSKKHSEKRANSRSSVASRSVRKVGEALKETSSMEEKINTRVKDLDDMIDAAVEDLVESVKKKAEEMHRELADIKKRKQKLLQLQKEDLGLKHAQLESVVCFADEAINKGREVEILAVKDQLVKRLQQLTTSEEFGVDENCIIDCNFDITEAKLCLAKCNVTTSNVVPHLTIVTTQDVPVEGQTTVVNIFTVDVEGRLAYYKGDNVTVKVLCPTGETLSDGLLNIVDHQDGQYTVSLNPATPGRYSVLVTIAGQPIRKVPHVIYASRDYSKLYYAQYGFGSQGKGQGQFSYPTGIAVNEAGEIAIADCLNHRIQVVRPDGTVLWVFGCEGNQDGQLREPKGLAFAKDGSLLVLDTGNNQVKVFSKDGKFLRKFGKEGTGPGQFTYPLGISVDKRDRILVADTRNCRIQVFNMFGQYLFQFGHIGPGKLKDPESVVFSKNQFIVADTNNHCLKFFDQQGQFLRCLGQYGKYPGQFNCPSHLSTDDNGFIFVNDFNNHRAQVLRPEGTCIAKFGGCGTWSSYMQYPRNVVVMQDGRVAVSDCGNHRIQIF